MHGGIYRRHLNILKESGGARGAFEDSVERLKETLAFCKVQEMRVLVRQCGVLRARCYQGRNCNGPRESGGGSQLGEAVECPRGVEFSGSC